MANTSHPPAIAGLSAVAPDYRALLCDVWGVVHNGLAAFPEAGAALARFRDGGGRVLLITNAPRLKRQVIAQLDEFGFPRAAYDDVVTSGEVSRDVLRSRPGAMVFHVGPERGLALFEGLDVQLTGAAEAELIVCTGLFDDETERPEDYDPQFADWLSRRLPMLCANPDLIVERGTRLVWCAGAIAERYAGQGGATTIIGKPHAQIYVGAFARLAEIASSKIDKVSVLAIGDGAATDVRGAVREGIDVLFVAGGIHAGQFGDRDRPDGASVGAFLADAGLGARAFIPKLLW